MSSLGVFKLITRQMHGSKNIPYYTHIIERRLMITPTTHKKKRIELY